MYARSLLTMPRPAPDVISAPGAGSFVYGKLRQEPSQTVSPSPPLPSKVPLPSPAELRSFAGQLARMKDDDQNHHLAGAVMHLESAAEKIGNNPVSALASLRSAQSAIQAEWRERVERNQPRIAYVFSDNAPPAERAAQQAAWAKAQASIAQMQGAASKVASFIDRVRRNYFGRAGMTDHTAGGGLAGFPTARLSAAELVRLAQVKAYTRVEPSGKVEHVGAYVNSKDKSADAGLVLKLILGRGQPLRVDAVRNSDASGVTEVSMTAVPASAMTAAEVQAMALSASRRLTGLAARMNDFKPHLIGRFADGKFTPVKAR